jgi:hypothetical protein
MFRKLSLLFASCALGLHSPAGANFVLEPTFAEKMARSELVVIGTVTAVGIRTTPGAPAGTGTGTRTTISGSPAGAETAESRD